MITITDKSHIDRLREKSIVIEDIFQRKGKILIRKSDGTRLDQVYNASRFQKKYYYKNKLIYTEKTFDKNSNYTFATYSKNNEIECPNCGNRGLLKDFYEGCPYCDTNFNIDYSLKRYNFSEFTEIFNSKKFKFFVVLFAIILPFCIVYFSKHDLIQALISILIFPLNLFLSYIICMSVYLPIIFYNIIKKQYKESKKIKSGEIDRKKIINSLHFELNNLFYNTNEYPNLIDYDIISYYSIFDSTIDNKLYIDISYKIRKYYLIDGKIRKKSNSEKIRLKYNNIKEFISTHKIVECGACGASIDVTKNKCEYCNTKIKTISEWSIDKIY